MEKYYISDGKTETGPYSIEQLKEIPINKNFLVWKQGMKEWMNISEIEELRDIAYAVPPSLVSYKNKIIKNYKIKHWGITLLLLILIGVYLRNFLFGFYIKISFGEAMLYSNLTVLLSVVFVIVKSILIYNRNMEKLK